MPILSPADARSAAIDAYIEMILREPDSWRQASLLAMFTRQRRDHPRLRALAEVLMKRRETKWFALEILTDPTASPPAEGPLWIEPMSGVCLVRIGPGTFRMGSESEEAYDQEKPVHEVEITGEYWLGRYPVTNADYARYLAAHPAAIRPRGWEMPGFNGPRQPVTGISWFEAEKGYCQWLREQTGLPFHLPTEAEWEYACRAGSETEYCFGDDAAELETYAWYGTDWNEKTGSHAVGLKRGNAWGLQDMHGNVMEWCWDSCDAYTSQPQRDPTGSSSGSLLVSRGGSWDGSARSCRSACRYGFRPGVRNVGLGFRLALSPVRRPEAG